MDSSSRPTLTELQPPDEPESIVRTFEGYRAALAQMTVQQQVEQLTRINAALEQESRTHLAQLISRPLSDYISSLDLIVPRSTPTAPPSSPSRDRGRASSLPSSPRPSPADLLFGSSRGRALAAKLVVASSRSSRR